MPQTQKRGLEDIMSAIERFLSVHAYGLFARTLFGARTPPEVMRARFDRFARVSRPALRARHPGLTFEDHRLGSLEVESVRAVPTPSCTVIHLHGGAFVFGSAATYRNRAMRLSYRLSAEVFVPDYRLAPEHPFPAALHDALVTYQYVRALRPSAPLFISGDSAGGGLALSLLVRLRELDAAMPEGAILLSPWTDLAATGASVDRNRARDRWLSRAHLEHWARYYLGSIDPRTPLLSPLYAELHGLSPLLVLAGEHEVLLDDALRVVERAQHAGTEARALVGRGMQHDWPLTLPWLDESKRAWREMAAFTAERSDSRALAIPAASFAGRASPLPT
jgi:monoterpene epsilon-lactone hydrolase